MDFHLYYDSPLGRLFLSGDDEALTELRFDDGGEALQPREETGTVPAPLASAVRWLDCYFSGRCPAWRPPIRPSGSPFSREVWEELLSIPCGSTLTYGEIADRLSMHRGGAPVAAQAVGGACGRNPIVLIVPCHRVVGKNGSLTGYSGGGVARKAKLLQMEKEMTETEERQKNTAP